MPNDKFNTFGVFGFFNQISSLFYPSESRGENWVWRINIFQFDFLGEFGSSVRHNVLYYRQQNGFLPLWMCREICRFSNQVLRGQTGKTAFHVGRCERAGEHSPNDATKRNLLVRIHISKFWWIKLFVFAALCKQGPLYIVKRIRKWSYQQRHSLHHPSLTSAPRFDKGTIKTCTKGCKSTLFTHFRKNTTRSCPNMHVN